MKNNCKKNKVVLTKSLLRNLCVNFFSELFSYPRASNLCKIGFFKIITVFKKSLPWI